MCRSVPQMPVDRTRTSTSFGPIAGTGTSTNESPGAGDSLTSALIVAGISGIAVVGTRLVGLLVAPLEGDRGVLLQLGPQDAQLLGQGAGLLVEP